MPEENKIPPMHTLTLRIPEEWYEVVREDAHRERLDITDLIRDALATKYRFRRFRMVKGAKPRVEYLDTPEEGRKGGALLTPGGASLTTDGSS